MYEKFRLTELHEECAAAQERAARYTRYMPKLGAETEAEALDAEIRRRVAAQEIGPPFLFTLTKHSADGNITPLLFGTPDALREYRRAPTFYFKDAHWTNHARHEVPVASCHLCSSGEGR
jgi:hypothetical protein